MVRLLDGAIALKADSMSIANEIYAENLMAYQLHPDYDPDIPNLVLLKLAAKIQVNLKPKDLPELAWFYPLDELGM